MVSFVSHPSNLAFVFTFASIRNPHILIPRGQQSDSSTMGHEEHHHEEKPLSFFASPLLEPGHEHGGHEKHAPESHTYASAHSSDIEDGKPKATDPNHVPFQNSDCELHDSPAYHRHAEATTAELFYDLFFVANLTTFTSNLEINDRDSLTAYIGFFALLWLTWYQVSLYDVRFSADSVFERIAKGIHFGVMVSSTITWSHEAPNSLLYRLVSPSSAPNGSPAKKSKTTRSTGHSD